MSDIQQSALDDIKDKEVSMPKWAVATVGILNALVTIVLALGINVGDIVDVNVKSDIALRQKQVEFNGIIEQKASEALAQVLLKREETSNAAIKQLELEKQIIVLKKDLERLKSQRR